jgi:hypothetical protein
MPALRHRESVSDPVVVAPLDDPPKVYQNTVLVTVGPDRVPYSVMWSDGREARCEPAELSKLVRGTTGLGADGVAPLFCLHGDESGGWAPYTQLSLSGAELMFIRLPGDVLRGNPFDPMTAKRWVTDLGRRHRAHGAQLNNHQRWFINVREGLEIEQKFTLPGNPDIWRLALAVRDIVAHGDLPGWITESGNDFEQWDFPNHVFEIREPRDERGYIAFIPAVDGRWIIRRKRYETDSPIRREHLIEGLTLPDNPDLAAIIGQRFGVQPHWVGTYQRLRYNVMLESLDTGHVFSVMFDRCSTDLDVPDLFQVEVEYVRSRTVVRRDPQDDGLMDDFDTVRTWTAQILAAQEVPAVQDHLSKLTWLRAGVRSEQDEIP